MGIILRILGALPRNLLAPAVAILAGWYGGAKYGAPDYLMASVDNAIAQGSSIVGAVLGNDEGEADASVDSEDTGTEV